MSTTDINLPNQIGFTKAYAVIRDIAKKKEFYGLEVRIQPSGASYYLPDGIVEVKVYDKTVSISAQPSTYPARHTDNIVSKLVKLFGEYNVPSYQSQSCKIFGTGLSRTGTTSLTKALQCLGVFGIHHAPFLFPKIMESRDILNGISEYDAFIDSPFSYFYESLDKIYPNSKFIHTTRAPEDWIKSFKWLMGNSSTPMSRMFYEVEEFNENAYLEKFLHHDQEVREYFSDRPDDLLIIDISKIYGWHQLCDFLNKPIPDTDYPNTNQRSNKETSGLEKI